MNWWSNKYLLSLSSVFFLLTIYLIGFHVERENFPILIGSYAVVFVIMVYWYKTDSFHNKRMFWAMIFLSRLILLFSIPLLSDDYFRFIWDGQLQVQGINPFSLLPENIEMGKFMTEVYNGLNSKEYFSVYPPVMQFIFWLSSLISGDNISMNLMILKGFVLIADLGLIYGIAKIFKFLGRDTRPIVLLALNPLLIVEVTGNLHFESMMMCFTVWAIYFLMKWEGKKINNSFVLAILLFSLGVLTKIVSLLLLPVLIRRIGLKNSILFGLGTLILTLLAFLPFADPQVVKNFSDSLDLYFRKFEFNASIYLLVNWMYEKFVGWQEIKYVGPALAITNVLIILFLTLRREISSWENFFETAMMVLTVHLLFSTTVHPWYVINLMAMAVFTNKRYVFVWSFTVILSYLFYKNYQMPFWLIALEYCLFLGYLIYESKFNGRDTPLLNSV